MCWSLAGEPCQMFSEEVHYSVQGLKKRAIFLKVTTHSHCQLPYVIFIMLKSSPSLQKKARVWISSSLIKVQLNKILMKCGISQAWHKFNDQTWHWITRGLRYACHIFCLNTVRVRDLLLLVSITEIFIYSFHNFTFRHFCTCMPYVIVWSSCIFCCNWRSRFSSRMVSFSAPL